LLYLPAMPFSRAAVGATWIACLLIGGPLTASVLYAGILALVDRVRSG
jgi:hypothetical protein